MKKGPENLVGREVADSPEKRRRMRQEELRRIYAEMERAPSRRKKQIGAVLALSTALAGAWWAFRYEGDLDKEDDITTETRKKNDESFRTEDIQRKIAMLKMKISADIAQATRSIEQAEERTMADKLEQNRNFRKQLYRTISDAEHDLSLTLQGHDTSWDDISEYLAELQEELEELLTGQPEESKLLSILDIETLWISAISKVNELIHDGKHGEALQELEVFQEIIQQDRRLLKAFAMDELGEDLSLPLEEVVM